MQPLVVHIAQIEMSEKSGMGRIAWHWKHEFEESGYDFIHIGMKEVGSLPHPALFPYAALKVLKQQHLSPGLLLVHEPAAGVFTRLNIPLVLFSHGIERRAWNLYLNGADGRNRQPPLKTKLLFPLWRLRHCDTGLSKADLLLLSNQEDQEFAIHYYQRHRQDIFVFQNGVYLDSEEGSHEDGNNASIQPDSLKFDTQEISGSQTITGSQTISDSQIITILFNASWTERKGIHSLIKAASILQGKSLILNWLLIGTCASQESIMQHFPETMHSHINVVPTFSAHEESQFLSKADIFILPSFFEGQPLSLLQAMAAGLCCITTNCCGQKDLIEHGWNGLLYPTGDAEKLADLIEQTVSDNHLRYQLGRNAQASVKHRSWETVASGVVQRIKTLILC
jgi:glycosyltransferase involved in cell wall biosynthesis